MIDAIAWAEEVLEMLEALTTFGFIDGGATLPAAGGANDLVREAAVGTGGRQLGSSSDEESESSTGGGAGLAAGATGFVGIIEGFLAGSGFLGNSSSTFAGRAAAEGSEAGGKVTVSSITYCGASALGIFGVS